MENNITKMIVESKPSSVTLAFRLILVSIAIGIINMILEYFEGGLYYYSTSGIIATALIIMGIILFLAFQIQRGKNWARIIFFIVVSIGIVFSVPQYMSTFSRNFHIWIIKIIMALIDIAVIVLLFNKQSHDWFLKIKNSMKG
ncbi:MAG: hypothetical protein V1874_01320 [Spirochaetota bacterium]